ncbi:MULTISPECIES: c-type cytochrome [Rhizobium]|nr:MULTISPECIES: cytochrome c [Rhizobium]MBB6489539.1 mono/diheme cytochrome c family protein [Rhizobium lusitanum]
MLSDGENFSEQSGEALYANVCAACHMNHGEGAMGAGKYPALTQNQNLVVGDYPVYLVLHGHTGMPPIGHMMSDDQVAAVVNYVRTNFGNNYENEVTREDVADIR